MTNKRRSLADRNRSAIASTAAADEQEADVPAVKSTASESADVRRISLTMTTQLYNDCKAAFLADFTSGGAHHQFRQWIEGAFHSHAARTPAERSEVESEATGSPRSFVVSTRTFTAITQAIADDQKIGRWLTLSAWGVEALTAAVQAARNANGGHLPIPPSRLPHRLMR